MNDMQPAPGDNRQVLPTQKEGDYDLLCWLRSIIDRETWLQAKSRAQMALDADYFDDRQYMGLSEEEVKELEDRGSHSCSSTKSSPPSCGLPALRNARGSTGASRLAPKMM